MDDGSRFAKLERIYLSLLTASGALVLGLLGASGGSSTPGRQAAGLVLPEAVLAVGILALASVLLWLRWVRWISWIPLFAGAALLVLSGMDTVVGMRTATRVPDPTADAHATLIQTLPGQALWSPASVRE